MTTDQLVVGGMMEWIWEMVDKILQSYVIA
jgi:hypothetical protein